MGLIGRIFGGRRHAAAARKAELQGDLARAIGFWAAADRLDEVARLMILRGDTETDPQRRLQHYVQAVATAPPGSNMHATARRKKASFTLAIAGPAPAAATTRRELLLAAKDLEDLGDTDRAAEAYSLLEDSEGQARALVQGGQIERLEALLSGEQTKATLQHERSREHAQVDMLVLSGRRREALAAAQRIVEADPLDSHARQNVASLLARRLVTGLCRVLVSGRPMNLLVDDEVVIGRTEGALLVRSTALSRRHLSIARRHGAIVAVDLASRNGTTVRGMPIAGPLPIGHGLDLDLGGVVKLRVAPNATFQDAIDVEVGGERYSAALGPFRLGIGTWRLERAADGWVELITNDDPPAYGNEMILSTRTTLLVGDKVTPVRGGQAALEIVG
jgi:FHA domain